MKLKIIAIILSVLLVVGIGTYIAVKTYVPAQPTPEVPTIPQTMQQQAVPTPQAIQGFIMLEPKKNTANIGEEVVYSVNVTSTAHIVGLEGKFTFDSKNVEIISVTPGNLFQKPELFANMIDTQQGTITYALGSFTPMKTQGEIVRITLKVLGKSPTVPLVTIHPTTKAAFVHPETGQPYTETETKLQFSQKALTVL